MTKLKLSDAFIHTDHSGEFEWTVTVYNLNRGKNDDLLKRCRALAEYMELVNRIRDNQKKMNTDEAVNAAIESCIKDGIMTEFLIKYRAEVFSVCITEFDEKCIRMESERKDARKDVRKV